MIKQIRKAHTAIEVARIAVKYFNGNIVEIGLGEGNTTLQLLKIAQEFKCKVIGVDPFESGWDEMPESYGKPYPFEIFQKTISGYEKYLILHKESSLSLSSEKILKQDLCFAFVDGLQYKSAVLNDLRIVAHAPVIVVDDINRLSGISQVMPAVKEFIKGTKRKLIIKDRWGIIV